MTRRERRSQEAFIQVAAEAYLADCMGMTTPYEDQEQNQLLRHLTQFGIRVARGGSHQRGEEKTRPVSRRRDR